MPNATLLRLVDMDKYDVLRLMKAGGYISESEYKKYLEEEEERDAERLEMDLKMRRAVVRDLAIALPLSILVVLVVSGVICFTS